MSAGLLALAERCEAATGADRELDGAIHFAIVLREPCPKEVLRLVKATEKFEDTAETVARYTASIDAALTLVPEGWVIGSVGEEKPREQWVVELRRGHRTSYDKVIFSDCEPGRRCKTFALAICAAALRARAA